MRAATPSARKALDHPRLLRVGPLTAMNWRPVPQDQQITGNVSEQMAEKVDHIGPFVSLLLHHHVEFTLRGDATNHRKMVPGQVLSDDRRLAPWVTGQVCETIAPTGLLRKGTQGRTKRLAPGLAARTVSHHHTVLREALAHAVK